MTDGYGGWENVKRPRRQSVTLWTGRDPFQMTVDLIFDGVKGMNPIELDCKALERMALPPVEGEEPPVVSIQSPMIMWPGLPWVITRLDWQDALRNSEGRRVRQNVTVTLTRYVKEDRLREQKASKRAAAKSKTQAKNDGNKSSTKKTVVAKEGDTVLTIAGREIRDIESWRSIANANNIRDPAAEIGTGRVIRLPG
jgi:hypothetical protein